MGTQGMLFSWLYQTYKKESPTAKASFKLLLISITCQWPKQVTWQSSNSRNEGIYFTYQEAQTKVIMILSQWSEDLGPTIQSIARRVAGWSIRKRNRKGWLEGESGDRRRGRKEENEGKRNMNTRLCRLIGKQVFNGSRCVLPALPLVPHCTCCTLWFW